MEDTTGTGFVLVVDGATAGDVTSASVTTLLESVVEVDAVVVDVDVDVEVEVEVDRSVALRLSVVTVADGAVTTSAKVTRLMGSIADEAAARLSDVPAISTFKVCVEVVSASLSRTATLSCSVVSSVEEFCVTTPISEILITSLSTVVALNI